MPRRILKPPLKWQTKYVAPETSDEAYMRMALEEARAAAAENEVPVGALIVRGDTVLAKAHNRREIDQDPTAHAELICLQKAARKLGSWRLDECTLYVTLEPCPMCAGTIINSRLRRVVYGASDPKAGALGSLYDLAEGKLNHRPQVSRGVLAGPCGKILTEYFRAKRKGGRTAADP